jgi:hypothetical protein
MENMAGSGRVQMVEINVIIDMRYHQVRIIIKSHIL